MVILSPQYRTDAYPSEGLTTTDLLGYTFAKPSILVDQKLVEMNQLSFLHGNLLKKGWNVYRANMYLAESVAAGPVTQLEESVEYLTLPTIGEPSNFELMTNAIGGVLLDLGAFAPSLSVGQNRYSLKNWQIMPDETVELYCQNQTLPLALYELCMSIGTLDDISLKE